MSLKRAIAAAVTLYRSFRERDPRRVGTVQFKVPLAVAIIGYVEAIDYRTTHGKKIELYRHDFEPGSRPLLAVSPDGLQLLLLGGRYEFTEQGIVDVDARGNLITNPKHGKSINPRSNAITTTTEPSHVVAARMQGRPVQEETFVLYRRGKFHQAGKGWTTVNAGNASRYTAAQAQKMLDSDPAVQKLSFP